MSYKLQDQKIKINQESKVMNYNGNLYVPVPPEKSFSYTTNNKYEIKLLTNLCVFDRIFDSKYNGCEFIGCKINKIYDCISGKEFKIIYLTAEFNEEETNRIS